MRNISKHSGKNKAVIQLDPYVISVLIVRHLGLSLGEILNARIGNGKFFV